MKNIKSKIKRFKSYRDLSKKYNTLNLDHEILKNSIKDKLLDAYLDYLNKPEELKRVKSENKKLRKQIKTYKDIIKIESSKRKKK